MGRKEDWMGRIGDIRRKRKNCIMKRKESEGIGSEERREGGDGRKKG